MKQKCPAFAEKHTEGIKKMRSLNADGCEQDTAKYFLLISAKPMLQVLHDSSGLVYLMLLSLLAPYEVNVNHMKVSVKKVREESKEKIILCRKRSSYTL